MQKAKRSKVTKPPQRSTRGNAASKQAASRVAIPRGGSHIGRAPRAATATTPGHMIHVSVDYGTKTLPAAYRVASNAPDAVDIVDIVAIREVQFSRRDIAAPQIIAFTDGPKAKRKMFWGPAVEDALKFGTVRPENVIEMWKLLLYRAHNDMPAVKRIQEQLDRLEYRIYEIITMHLREVRKTIEEKAKQSLIGIHEGADVEDMPMHLLLSVPALWKPPACRLMMTAARNAGFEHAELIPEPEAAAALHTHTFKHRLNNTYNIGDEMLIADIGGGTEDFVRVRIESDLQDGAKVKLHNSGHASGALCGSEMVNERFRAWLVEEYATESTSSFQAICKQLGLTEVACLKTASDQFEIMKREFSVPEAPAQSIVIMGAQGSKKAQWVITVTSANMVGFFEPVLATVEKSIRDQLKGNAVRIIHITGGFGRSVYLSNQLQQAFPGVDIADTLSEYRSERPVANGALLRWDELKDRGFAPDGTFGLAAIEDYEREHHPDATIENGRVERDRFTGEMIVYERWTPLTDKSESTKPGAKFTNDQWQFSTIKPGQEMLEITIYWAEADMDMKAHDRMREGSGTGRNPLRQGIEKWGPKLKISIPDLEALGFERRQGQGRYQGLCYNIWWRVHLEGEGANVRVTWELCEPGKQPFDQLGKQTNAKAVFMKGKEQMVHLSQEKSNPFVRRNV